MLFKKKDKDKKDKPPRGLASYFRNKPREQRKRTILYYVALFLLITLALNFALLLPTQLSSVFYEAEILIISSLRLPIKLQLWMLIVFYGAVLLSGYFLLPVITIPSTEEWYIVVDTWEEGDVRFFRTLGGKVLHFHTELVKPLGLIKHWFPMARVKRYPIGGYVLYQTDDMEVTKSLSAIRLAEMLANQNAIVLEEMKDIIPRSVWEELKEILKNNGGGEE